MFYIHSTYCISAQNSLLEPIFEDIITCTDNKMFAIEPSYKDIPLPILRRMGKAVRIGVGAFLKLLEDQTKYDGIIVGTANGGLEDCIKFLDQIMEYDEGTLTPTNFVQSTANAIASQVALLSRTKGYNITHVHRGHAFENAALDAAMRIKENPSHTYLLGGIEEISSYNYNINYLGGWYKKEPTSNKSLYEHTSSGSIAGEGAAAFKVSGEQNDAIACLRAMQTIHGDDGNHIKAALEAFLAKNTPALGKIDLLLSGEDGDARMLPYYLNAEDVLGPDVPIARFKHLSGEFETATAIAMHIACQILLDQKLPEHMLKTGFIKHPIKNILIYNTTKGYQHSLMLLTKDN